jgi:hypothetical protein
MTEEPTSVVEALPQTEATPEGVAADRSNAVKALRETEATP